MARERTLLLRIFLYWNYVVFGLEIRGCSNSASALLLPSCKAELPELFDPTPRSLGFPTEMTKRVLALYSLKLSALDLN